MSQDIDKLLEIMALLRDPARGCPWDVEQTFATIAPHTIEEAYEVADAIEKGDMAGLEDELGDLLLQVVFHARMAEEKGLFDFRAVVGRIVDKLIRRHPHVFGDEVIADAAAQTVAWEDQKARERQAQAEDAGAHSAIDGVSPALPALTRALKLQKRAARVGFDWAEAAGILDKITEEIEEVKAEMAVGDRKRLDAEVGDLLFSCVNLARKLDIEPEGALRRANLKFEDRFRRMEALVTASGKSLKDSGLNAMDSAWNRAKAEEKAR